MKHIPVTGEFVLGFLCLVSSIGPVDQLDWKALAPLQQLYCNKAGSCQGRFFFFFMDYENTPMRYADDFSCFTVRR